MSKRKRVKNTIKSRKEVKAGPNPETPFKRLTFDFTYNNWLKSISTKYFTNKLKNNHDFSTAIIEIIYELFPKVQDDWEEIKKHSNGRNGKYPHCHLVATNKLSFVKKIVENIHDKDILDPVESKNDENDSLSLWQIGIKQGIRVIGAYNSNRNVFYPLFVDYHHLIHPNQHYNQNDLDNYNFCPIDYYNSKQIIHNY